MKYFKEEASTVAACFCAVAIVALCAWGIYSDVQHDNALRAAWEARDAYIWNGGEQ